MLFKKNVTYKIKHYILKTLAVNILVLTCLLLSAAGENDTTDTYHVSAENIVRAMNRQTGYNILTTTNGSRFHTGVLFALIEDMQEQKRDEMRIFFSHENNLASYKSKTGLPFEKLPIYVQRSYKNRQDEVIEFGVDRIVKKVIQGERPKRALTIHAFWSKKENPAAHYAYDDTLSDPNLRVVNARDIRLKVLDFGDMILYDEVQGLKGRPTSGLLGMLFKIIGEGSVVQSRAAISEDGLQIVIARSKKGIFSITTTATIYPDGRAIKGLPDDRPDLEAVVKRLKRPIKIEYW